MWAIIGGSGFENFEGFETLEELDTKTPFGQASSGLRRVNMEGEELLFVSRHGAHHERLPSEVNFRANIFALKKYGARRVLSISAVGSLQEECRPGDLVVPDQYIDRTKGRRQHTFLGDGVVGHVSLAHPVQKELIDCIESMADQFDFKIHCRRTHLVIEGPTFSTRAESLSYRELGADVIGMTNYPEYALAREAGLCYLPLSFVTDYDCWKDDAPHVTLQEVLTVMRSNNSKAYRIATQIVKNSKSIFAKGCPDDGLKNGLMTPMERLSKEQKSWLEVLIQN